jgi:hypothetical protein
MADASADTVKARRQLLLLLAQTCQVALQLL